MQRQQNTLTRDKRETELIARGRRDPCVVPRGLFMKFHLFHGHCNVFMISVHRSHNVLVVAVYYLLSVGMSLSEHKA
ncbi:embryo defective 1144 (c4973) [Olea europaea subsp. europaea]|uniref:Embryo defective 1144 (C4973), partial n=1 Tax=Olea europaea subsp. europaea TaxID=158383 RepID=A0A8S0UZ31_OLEEU|nr:embryo defective 1144 (c4973) [Olea europaea subsp. europaea]